MRATILVVLLAASVSAQQPAFKSGVELVRIPVHVTGASPAPLDATDFRVTEAGALQTITVFERESLSLSICILLDVSGSMGVGHVPGLAAAALKEMTALLTPADEISIVTFASSVRVLVPWMPPVQAARLPLTSEIVGWTSLLDATRTGLDMLQSARNPHSVLLLITDGLETSSRLRLEEVVTNRRHSEAQIYAFEIASPSPQARMPQQSPLDPGVLQPGQRTRGPFLEDAFENVLKDLVGDSGGTIYRIQNPADPRRAAQAFVNDLRYQYTLGYTPTRPFDGRYRRVKVEVVKRGYQVRHRGGYLALPAKADR